MRDNHAKDANECCPICPKVYFAKRGLNKHLNEHATATVVNTTDESLVIEVPDDISFQDPSSVALNF